MERVPNPVGDGRGRGHEPEARVPDGALGHGLESAHDRVVAAIFSAASAAGAADSAGSAVLLVAGVGLGSLVWDGILAMAAALLGRAAGPRLLCTVDLVAGVGLISFGCVLAYSVVS